jgi:predicted transcriptional regulator
VSKETNPTFGDLELEILSLLWEADTPLLVADVHSRLQSKRELAYTTVLTVLGNLFKKKAVDRARQGKAHVYWAVHKREQAAAGMFSNLLNRIYNNNPAEMLAGFLKTGTHLTAAQIADLKDELEKLEEEL